MVNLWMRKEGAQKNALTEIQNNKATFIEAERQASAAKCSYDSSLAKAVMDDFGEIEKSVLNAAGEELDTLISRSQDLKNMRAYLLPRHEIEAQGKYVIAELREWSVPQSVLKSIEDDFLNALQKGDLNAARAALYNIFDSSDYWNMYIDWFTGFMRYIASILMGLMLLSLAGAFICILHGFATPGFILAGACGALVSVISKLPPLVPYGETAGYIVRIIGRVAVGIAACVIGYGLLASGILTVGLPDKSTLADLINGNTVESRAGMSGNLQKANVVAAPAPAQNTNLASTADSSKNCPQPGGTTRDALILIAIAMLFGFSERSLSSFENKIFPGSEESKKQ
jgi:hypothetical protein